MPGAVGSSVSARLAREIAGLEATNARLRTILARRPTRLPRWAIVLLAVEACVACGGTLATTRVGASLGRSAVEVEYAPWGGPSEGTPGYCLPYSPPAGAR